MGGRQFTNVVNSEKCDRLTSDNVDAIHDTAGDGLPSLSGTHICVEIKMFCNTSTGGAIHSNSVNLESKDLATSDIAMAKTCADLIQES